MDHAATHLPYFPLKIPYQESITLFNSFSANEALGHESPDSAYEGKQCRSGHDYDDKKPFFCGNLFTEKLQVECQRKARIQLC